MKKQSVIISLAGIAIAVSAIAMISAVQLGQFELQGNDLMQSKDNSTGFDNRSQSDKNSTSTFLGAANKLVKPTINIVPNNVSKTLPVKSNVDPIYSIATPDSNSTYFESNVANYLLSGWSLPQLDKGVPVALDVDLAGGVWFTEDSAEKIGRLVPASDEITRWSLPYSGFPRDIVGDRNGLTWFVEVTGNKIGRLDPVANEITEWQLPTRSTHPVGIEIDESGKVWFTEDNGNKIGRLDPVANEITEWQLPTKNVYILSEPYGPSSRPLAIFVDASQMIWFNEFLGEKIGRLDPVANEITEWQLPKSVLPSAIVTDPLGSVWFTQSTGEISVLDPTTDKVTSFSIPSVSTGRYALDIDQHGNVWFIQTPNVIARLSLE